MAELYLERENKYDVDQGWVFPDLGPAVPPGARVEQAEARLSSVYYDTADRDLLSRGVTLRRRSGDLDAGWQLKLPTGAARTEVRLPAAAGQRIPKELKDLLLGLRGGRLLRPVAKLDTHRRLSRVVDDSGTLLAELADDEVHAAALDQSATVNRWREVEVELGAADEQLVAALGALLTEAGATPSGSQSKLARALTWTAPQPRSSDDRSRYAMGDVVGRYLQAQYQALLDGDVALRLGQDAVHPTRVATRRYRSVLRVFADLFESDRAAALDSELAWFASLLGQVRDRQVMRNHLDLCLRSLPPNVVLGPVAARIEELLLSEQLTGQQRLTQAMRGRRYLALLAELKAWHLRPPLTESAARPATEVTAYLRQAGRTLRRRLAKASRPRADDELLHRTRKAAKRTRYIAELAEPVIGKPARRVVKRATALQDTLGAHQDSIVTSDLLRRLGATAGSTAGENGFTYGVLYANEQDRADTTRKNVRKTSWRTRLKDHHS